MSTYKIHLSKHTASGVIHIGWVCKHGVTSKMELALNFTEKQAHKVLSHYHAERNTLQYEADTVEVRKPCHTQ